MVIILYSEIVWVILYSYIAITGITNDDIILTSSTFFLLALAGLEFCIGFILSILFRNFKKSLDLNIFNIQNDKDICLNTYSYC